MNITYHQYIIYANLHYPEQVFPQPFLLMHKILAFFSPQLKHKKQVIRIHVASSKLCIQGACFTLFTKKTS